MTPSKLKKGVVRAWEECPDPRPKTYVLIRGEIMVSDQKCRNGFFRPATEEEKTLVELQQRIRPITVPRKKKSNKEG